jgi:hypothetical protein
MAVILALSAAIFWAQTTRADMGSCSITTLPQTAYPNNRVNFQFNLSSNDGNDPIKWILITTPKSDFNIISTSASGWSSFVDSSGAEFNNGNLNPGDSLNLNVEAQTGNFQAGEIDWGIYAYDGAGGGQGNSVCQNVSPLNMVDNTPYISNVAVGSVTANSIAIQWATSLPATSQINYGFDDNYGSSNTLDTGLVTNHSMVLKGLKSNSVYHYQVVSTTPDGGYDTSGDSTFLTAVKEASVSQVNTSLPLNTPIPIKAVPAEKIPPVIGLSTALSNPYKIPPTISGTASDNVALAAIEYSLDGGKNWLPVDQTTGLGGKNATFSFTAQNLDDGNYQIIARAIDTSGNIGLSAKQELVIDRLPPTVGGSVISLGPQVLQPDQNGNLKTLAGVDEKITLSAVGGATSITLNAQNTTGQAKAKSFSLTQSADSGLWSGILSFGNPGTYRITANAVDGAGNKTSRLLNNIIVLAAGKVVKQGNNQPLAAKITVYYLDSEANDWVVWDGAAYAQSNPQTTDKNGDFSLFLPAGKYYLKATAKGYRGLTSNIFSLSQPTPISATLAMKPGKLGPLNFPWLDFSTEKINLVAAAVKSPKEDLIGQVLPSFSLSDSNGNVVNSLDWLAKPTVVTLVATWAPAAAEQLPALSQLQADKNINVEPVALGQNAGQVQAYDQIAGYRLNWLADSDDTTTKIFNIQSLPTHYFINRNGVIRQIVTGVLSKQELLNDLSSL